jgi:hypothetical protein
MKELLLKHGFKCLGANAYTKGNYVAVLWLDESKVYISKLSPKYKRTLHSNVYQSESELKTELEKNHPL